MHDTTPLARRTALAAIGTSTLVGLAAACGNDTSASGATTTTAGEGGSAATGSDGSTSCEVIPEETAGPYPGDGSNGPDVLALDGVVRRDIRSSFAGASGTAVGDPFELSLTVLDSAAGCAPLVGAAVYLWHCDAEGRYSMYSRGATEANWLRGVQVTDADGKLGFTTVYPGCYDGRWPHMHFEVYPSEEAAIAATDRIRTSQIAFPDDVSAEVYTSSAYPTSAANLRRVSLETDMVFRDGWSLEMATISGTPGDALAGTLTVVV